MKSLPSYKYQVFWEWPTSHTGWYHCTKLIQDTTTNRPIIITFECMTIWMLFQAYLLLYHGWVFWCRPMSFLGAWPYLLRSSWFWSTFSTVWPVIRQRPKVGLLLFTQNLHNEHDCIVLLHVLDKSTTDYWDVTQLHLITAFFHRAVTNS